MLKQQGKKVLNFKRRVIKPKTCQLRVFPRAECLISTLRLNSIREYWRLAAVAAHNWILVEVIASAPCAESAQSCMTLWDPMDCRPSGSSVHWDSPGKNTGVGCHFPFQGLLPTRGWTCVSCTGRPILYHTTTWGTPECFSKKARYEIKCNSIWSMYQYFSERAKEGHL